MLLTYATLTKGLLSLLMIPPVVAITSCAKNGATSVEKADLVILNGVVYTADANDTIVEALAVRDGKIVALGKSANVEKYVGLNTEVINLAGGMVLPGMIDSHLHAPGIVLTELYNISLNWTDSKDVILGDIKKFIEDNPDLDSYFGSGWSIGAFEGEETKRGPKKEHLDEISLDKPITLSSYDTHSAWVNSRALEVAGITKETPNPEGGVIEKDPVTGELWGTLKGAATGLVSEQVFTFEQKLEGVKAFQSFMHSLGYTGILTVAGVTEADVAVFDAFKLLEEIGELNMWVRGAGIVDIRREEDLKAQVETLKNLRDTYNSELFKITTAGEIFIDGVVEGLTARLLEPYEEAAGKGPDYYGIYYWEDMGALKEAFKLLNSAGFQIHIHAIGDRAVRDALDALEYARISVPGDHRNAITHLQLVSTDDVSRFKELGIIANVQVFWHLKEPGWWEYVDAPFLGERAKHQYPLGSLFRAGAVVVSSSDHPVTPIPNPLWGIKVGVTRNLSNAEFYGVEDIENVDDPTWLLNKEERVSLKDMIKSFSANNAYSLFLDDKTGTIALGKYADLVILEEDLFVINPLRIDGVKILKTIFRGKVVYHAEK